MYTLTINGNTPEELFANLEKMAAANKGVAPANVAQPLPQQQIPVNPTQPVTQAVQPPIATPTIPFPMPQTDAAPVAAATATNVTPAPASPVSSNPVQANPALAVPIAAPTYTLETLARAGAALAQSGKMDDALALLARYGVQTVNQLKPEQYGAFATELRALGAQV